MAVCAVPLIPTRYSDAIDLLRRTVQGDRTEAVSTLEVSNGIGQQLKLFMQQSDLYVIGLDFGLGPYRFKGVPPDALRSIGETRELEFTFDYRALGFTMTHPKILVDGPRLAGAVQLLATHPVARNGSAFSVRHKEALVQLLFVTAEATRFDDIQKDVTKVLRSAHDTLDLHAYHATVTNWRELSNYPGADQLGVAVLHRSALPKSGRNRRRPGALPPHRSDRPVPTGHTRRV